VEREAGSITSTLLASQCVDESLHLGRILVSVLGQEKQARVTDSTEQVMVVVASFPYLALAKFYLKGTHLELQLWYSLGQGCELKCLDCHGFYQACIQCHS